MKPTALTLIVSLAAAPVVAAPCHATGSHGHQKLVAPAVAVPVVGVTVPLYGAAYSPSAFSPTGGDPTDTLGQILEEIRAMRRDLAAIRGPDVGALGKDPVGIVRANCAACHTGDAEKGGGFALFTDKGEPIKLSPADRREVTKRVANGSMPPASKGKLSQADKDALLGALKDAPKAPAAKKESPPKK